MRQTAAEALGGKSGSKATNALIEMLKAPQANVRRAAALSLGKRGSPPARKALAALLDDPEMRVRQTAVTLHSSLDNLRRVIL
ncbi:MAG: HEAT repeat domain-containing protein [Anaerolineales bacterium]|nr:HEAT repeat domain-containing protein [Anaerolineales bacterium]